MLVFTAKLNRKKAIILAAAVILLLAVIITTVRGGRKEAAPAVALLSVVRDNGDRVDYLNSLGWEVAEEPIDTQIILIPKEMGETYAAYNQLQNEQGFDLAAYGGLQATRYTYQVLNYPGAAADTTIVADLVVYRNEVIAGDVQSTRMDGFMQGLTYPR